MGQISHVLQRRHCDRPSYGRVFFACGVLGLASYDRAAFDRAVLPNAATAYFVDDLVAMTVEERRALPYMHPGRADVIGAGGLIWGRILDRVPVIEHVVSEADILHGMAAAIAR